MRWSQDINNPRKAVVRVKGKGKWTWSLEFKQYVDDGYLVYLLVKIVVDQIENN